MAATTKNFRTPILDVYLECLLLSQSISKGTEIRTIREGFTMFANYQKCLT